MKFNSLFFRRNSLLLCFFAYLTFNSFSQPNPGNCLTFDGINDYVTINSNSNVEFVQSNNFTIECWLKPDKLKTANFFDKTGTFSYRLSIWLSLSASGNVFFNLGQENYRWDGVTTNWKYTPNTWFHVTAIKDGNTIKLYINGKLDNTSTLNFSNATNPSINIPITLGRFNRDNSDYFSGSMDELRVWNYARTETQVQNDLHKTLNGDEPGLVAYYSFNQTSGTTLLDLSNSNLNGILNNFTTNYWVESNAIIQPIVTTSSIDTSSFSISWNNIDNADYYLDVSTNTDFNPSTRINNRKIENGTSYIIDSLTKGTIYYYRLRSNTLKFSEYSKTEMVTTTMKLPGNSLIFDGINEYVTIPFNGQTLSNTITVETWFKTPATWGTSVVPMLLSQTNTGVDGWNLYINDPNNGGGSFAFIVLVGNRAWTADMAGSSIKIENNKWYHLAGVRETNGRIKLYVNGDLIGNSSMDTIVGTDAINYGPGAPNIQIGQKTNSQYLKGQLDEIRIWKTALSQNDIRKNMYKSLTGKENGLVHYFNFDQTSGTFLQDLNKYNSSALLINMENSDWIKSEAMLIPQTHYPNIINHNSFTAYWDTIPDAKEYLIQLATDSLFNTIIFKDTLLANSLNITGLISATKYYYRVCAKTNIFNPFSAYTKVVTPMLLPGNAIELNGVNQSISIPSFNLSSNAFTVEGWVYLNSYTNYCRFIDFGNGIGIDNIIVFLSEGTNGYPGFSVLNGTVQSIFFSNYKTPLNQWVHFAATFQGTTGKLYMNGEEIGQNTNMIFNSNATRNSNYIGRSNWPSDGLTNGKFDEIRIWNNCLTQQQLIQNMHKSLSGRETGLIAYYNFDASSGNILKDVTGNLNATLINTNNSNWKSSDAVIPTIARNAININNNSFTAIWDSVPNASKYILEVSPFSDFSVLFKKDSTTSCKYVVNGINSYQYFYRLKTQIYGKYSIYSNIASVLLSPGNTLSFDGFNDSISIPYNPSYNFGTGAFTLEAWVKNTNTPGANYKRLITRRSINDQNFYSLVITNNKPCIELSIPGNGILYSSTTDIQGDNLWHHIAAVRESNGTLNMYIDGVKTYLGINTFNLINYTKLEIGNWWTEVYGNERYRGQIDEVRIWNIARSENELKNNMHKELIGNESGLIGYFNFNSTEGALLKDLSSLKNHGKIYNITDTAWKTSIAIIRPFIKAVSAITTNSFKVTWDSIPNATKYYIEISSESNFSKIEKYDSVIIASYNATNIKSSTCYFRVRSKVGNRLSSYSNKAIAVLIPGNAVKLEIDDYIYMNGIKWAPKQFSVEWWMKVSNFGPYLNSISAKIGWGGFMFHTMPDQTYYIGTDVNKRFTPDYLHYDKVEVNKWTHFAFTFDNGFANIYKNGKLIASKSDLDIPLAWNGFEIGDSSSTERRANQNLFDELRIWNYSLTQEQILANLHKTLSGKEQGLVAYYNFDKTVGNNLPDLSPNRYDGIMYYTNDAVWVPSSAVIIPFTESTKNSSSSCIANWDSIPFAEKYYIDISTNSTFSPIIKSDSTLISSYSFNETILNDNNYYFRVRTKYPNRISDISETGIIIKDPGNAIELIPNNYIITKNTGELGIYNHSFTLEYWFNSSSLSGDRMIFGTDLSLGVNKGMHIGTRNNYLYMGFLANDCSGTIPLTTNKWYHVAFVYDKDSAKQTIYLNGKLDNKRFNASPFAADIPLWLGRAGTIYYSGKLDEVRIWDYARTQNQIQSTLHNLISQTDTGLMAYYQFDSITGSIIKDASINKNDGSIVLNTIFTKSEALISTFFKDNLNYIDSGLVISCDSILIFPSKYIFQISKNNTFSDILRTDTIITTNYKVKSVSPGTYWLRVKTLLMDGRISQWSDEKQVIIPMKVPGNALKFNGNNNYVEINNNSLLSPNAFTISAWVNITGNNNTYRSIVSYRYPTPRGYVLYASDQNTWQFWIGNGNQWLAVESKEKIENNRWYYVTGVYTGNSIKLYVDGILQNTISAVMLRNLNRPFRIGMVSEAISFPMNGMIDEVALWDSVLTDVGIMNNMHRKLIGNEKKLVCYFNFDYSNGNTLYNLKNSLLNGTLINMADSSWKESFAIIQPVIRKVESQLTSINIKWDTIPNKVKYYIELATDSAFKTIILSDSTINESYNAIGLNEGTVYFIRLQVKTHKFSKYSYAKGNTGMVIPGNALLFDGIDDYISADKVSKANYKKGFTLEAWVNIDKNLNTSSSSKFIMGFHEQANLNDNRCALTIDKNKLVYYNYSKADNLSYTNTATDSIQFGTWVHIALVVEPYNNGYIYMNGIPVKSFTSFVLPDPAGKFTLGQDWDNGVPSDFYKGFMDEIRVWNTVRTQKQLIDNLHKTLTGNETGLVAYYNFDISNGNKLPDLTINNNFGTLINMHDTSWKQSMAIIEPTARPALNISYNSFIANWDSIPGISNYTLDVSTKKNFSVLDVANSIAVNKTNYELDNLKDETNYYYRLKYNKGIKTAYSNIITLITSARKPRILNDSINTLCDYDTLILKSNFMKNNIYQWYRNDTLFAGADSASLFITKSGRYKFRAVDTIYKDTAWANQVIVTINTSKFGANFTATPTSLSSPNSYPYFKIAFTNSTPVNSKFKYFWDFGDVDTTSKLRNPNHYYKYNGLYSITLTVTDTITTCRQKAIKTNYIACSGGMDNFDQRIIISGNSMICPSGSVKLAAVEHKAQKYQWKFDGANIIGATDSIYYATKKGDYNCYLETPGVTSRTSFTVSIDTFSTIKPIIFSLGNIHICRVDTLKLYTDQKAKHYNWSNGSTKDTILITNGGSYKVSITDNNNCLVTSNSIVITEETVPVPKICLVTVDLNTGRNMVIWDRYKNKGIANYSIYRQGNQTGIYNSIGSMIFDSVSRFVDTVFNNDQRVAYYKLTATDSCGNESAKSPYHKTILLQYYGNSGGINLHWDNYKIENDTISFISYIIYRSDDSLGPFVAIDTVAGNEYAFIDKDPISMKKSKYYRVGGLLKNPCSPAILKASTGPFSQSISNLEDNRIKGNDVNQIIQFVSYFRVHPNPFSNQTTLSYSLLKDKDVRIEIYDNIGKKLIDQLYKNQSIGTHNYTFTGNDSKFYIVKLSIDGKYWVEKVIKE